jgi:hypothetical protein
VIVTSVSRPRVFWVLVLLSGSQNGAVGSLAAASSSSSIALSTSPCANKKNAFPSNAKHPPRLSADSSRLLGRPSKTALTIEWPPQCSGTLPHNLQTAFPQILQVPAICRRIHLHHSASLPTSVDHLASTLQHTSTLSIIIFADLAPSAPPLSAASHDEIGLCCFRTCTTHTQSHSDTRPYCAGSSR